MSQFFGKVKTRLDLNGPSLEFATQPVSVATTGVGIGSTGGPDVTLSGIATVGFINTPDSPPPCIAVIDEDSSGDAYTDWNNFYELHPNRKFYLMDVPGGYVGVPSTSQNGVIENFRKFDVNRDNGVAAEQSDWFALAGISADAGYSLVSLWVDNSGSMTPANVQASLDLFLAKCSNVGLTVEQAANPASYNESYIQPFITELTGPPAPVNKGSVGYQWYESGVGKLVDGDKYVGTASTTLTIKNIITPTDNDRKYYLEADYIPGQPGARTGNATNEPFKSGIATVTVTPILDIISQPSTVAVPQNINATFTIDAQLSNGTTGGITYQWQIDEENITDGDISYNTAGSTLHTQQLPDASRFTIPADATNIVLDLAAGPGGNGGNGLPPEDYGTGGAGGAGLSAWFRIPDSTGTNRVLSVAQGYRGSDGVNGGAGGINPSGSNGATGGSTGTNTNFGASQGNLGGGGGSATVIRMDGHKIIVLGGGGGGGAAGKTFQHPHDGKPGRDANQLCTGAMRNSNTAPLFLETDNITTFSGGHGEGSGGSGGGGGGYGETSGVNGGDEGTSIGLGGCAGLNAYDPSEVQHVSGSLNPSWTYSDGWVNISYNSESASNVSSQNLTVSGTQTPTLTIKSDSVLTRRIRCVVSHTSEDIPDLISNTVNFICQSTVETSTVNIETIGISQMATLTSHDLSSDEYTFEMVPSSSTSTVLYYCFYSPDKDIDIEMDLYGGMGVNVTSINGTQNIGGQGGYSRIRFTLERNTEYIITGLNDIIDAPFVYRKATLIACVGQGGAAAIAMDADGGAGGGVSTDGAAGGVWGGGGGRGGNRDNLTTTGVYGSLFTTTDTTSIYYVTPPYPLDSIAQGTDGGQAITCPKGVHFAQEGLSPCQDITDPTLSHFRFADSREVWNSGLINRGYKAGYDMIQTAGAGDINGGGNGGNGATGGQGGTSNCGGGGGSGYTDGSVTVLDTQQGGSSANSKVVIRLAV